MNFVPYLQKFKTIVCLILLLTFMLLFNDVATDIDWIAHAGGLVSGLFMSFMLTPLKNEAKELILRIIFGVLFAVMGLGSILFFYLLPQKAYSE